jgi:hypothetical protein
MDILYVGLLVLGYAVSFALIPGLERLLERRAPAKRGARS